MPPRPAGTWVVFASVYCADHPVEAFAVETQHLIASAERVQLGPAGEVLERIVRTVVRAPAQDALHVAALVVVLPIELGECRRARVQHSALQHRPLGRFHLRVDADDGGCAHGGHEGGPAAESDAEREGGEDPPVETIPSGHGGIMAPWGRTRRSISSQMIAR